MEKEFKIRNILFKEDVDGKKHILSSNQTTKILLDVTKIRAPEQVVGAKGKVLKNACRIQYEDIGELILAHPYEEIRDLKVKPIIRGFGHE